jgi:hypothetical protein
MINAATQNITIINRLCLKAEILAPGTPLKRSKHLVPRIDTVWNFGSHRTHMLDSNREMVEYRASDPKQLSSCYPTTDS